MKKSLLTLFVSWLMILALIAPFRVNAQSDDFEIYCNIVSGPISPDSGRLHQQGDGPGTYVLASNSYARLYSPSANFGPSASGTCGFPYPTSCNNLRVLVLLPSGVFAQLVSVSNNVIEFIVPTVPSTGNQYGIYIQKQISPGVWVSTHGTGNDLTLEARSFQIFIDTQGRLVGSLYGHDGTYIKSLTDGQPNPRTYGGQPTIIQLYATGIKNVEDDFLSQRFLPPGSLEFSEVTTNPVPSAPGVYTLNFVRPGGWEYGSHFLGFDYPDQSSPSVLGLVTFGD